MNHKQYWMGMAILALTAALAGPSPSWGQVATAPAAKAAATTQDAEMRAIIADLGDANAATSEAAQKKLDGVPRNRFDKVWVTQQQMMEDGTIKVRALDRLAQWEEKMAMTPTLITLDMKDKSIDDMIEEISKQGGVQIKTQPPRQFRSNNNNNGNQKEKLFTLHEDKQPFWLAVRDLSGQMPMTIDSYGGNDNSIQFNLYNQNESSLNVMAGDVPLHVAANSIERFYRTNLQSKDEKNRDSSTFTVRLTTLADPALQIVNGSWKTVATEITDDKGHSLMVEKDKNNNMQNMNWGSSGWLCSATIPLKYPADAGEKIKILKGTVSAEVVVRHAHAVFEDLKANASVEFGDMDLTFEGVKSQGERNYSVKVKFEQGGATNAVWQNLGQWGRGPMIKLYDAAGKAYQQNGMSSTGGGTSWVFEPGFYWQDNNDGSAKIGPPAKVVITMAAKTKVVVVPFEFHDLKLP